MAKKRGKTAKQSSAKKAAPAKPKKAAAKIVKAAPAKAQARAKTARPPAASSRGATPSAPAESALSRAERLRDTISRSKMTHPSPWEYTAKARGWSVRAERLVVDAEAGREIRAALDALAAELEGDRDFQEARRLF